MRKMSPCCSCRQWRLSSGGNNCGVVAELLNDLVGKGTLHGVFSFPQH
jgi:hypothetical protein